MCEQYQQHVQVCETQIMLRCAQMASYLGQKEIEELVTSWMHGAALKIMERDCSDMTDSYEHLKSVHPSAYEGFETEWTEVILPQIPFAYCCLQGPS
jgi:hypothetical protein